MPSDEEKEVEPSPRALANKLASALKRAEGPYSPEEIEAAVEYLLLDLLAIAAAEFEEAEVRGKGSTIASRVRAA